MHKSISEVKEETKIYLLSLGYDEKAVNKLVNSFWKVTRYYNGKPSAVITTEGQEIFL